MSLYSELKSIRLTEADIQNIYKALDTLLIGKEPAAKEQIAIMQCFTGQSEYDAERRQAAFSKLLEIAISTETAPIHT